MESIQFVITLELTMNLYFLDFYARFLYHNGKIDGDDAKREAERQEE